MKDDQRGAKRTPLWKSIADTLRAEIGAGHYRQGEKLPTENALATRFGVNRHTLRRALAALAHEGLVHSRRGAGVFIASKPLEYTLGRRVRYHQIVIAAGQTPSRAPLLVETRAASAEEAEHLRIEPGSPVHVFEGLSLADEIPIALSRSVFPAGRFPGLAAQLRAGGSVSEALAAEGLADYLRDHTRISAQLATATQAVQLQLRDGAPLLRTEAINTDPQGRPVEYGVTLFAASRVTLGLRGDDEA